MTTQTKPADPVLPPLPENAGHVYTMEALVPGAGSQGHVMLNTGLPAGSKLHSEAQTQAYGRACYAQARADLIAEMRSAVADKPMARATLEHLIPKE